MRQPDPTPGKVPVAPVVLATLEQASRQHGDYVDLWPWLEQRLQDRIEAGRQKYGTLLETENGRNALEDAWQEAADLVQYLTQDWLEGKGVGMILVDARNLLLRISRCLWEREHPRMICVSTPGPGVAVYERITREIEKYRADDRAVQEASLFDQPIPPETEERLRNRWRTTEFVDALVNPEPVDDQIVYGPRDKWDDWRGTSEPE